MNDTVVVTIIYSEFWGTEEFRKSVDRVGLPLYNAFKGPVFTGNGNAMKMIYDAYVLLKDKYKYAIYSDGADTIFLKPFTPPDNKIIYSAEKAIWPPTAQLTEKWNNYHCWHPNNSPWKHLNGGNCCGPIELLIEFYERYDLDNHVGEDINGQLELSLAYLQAKKEVFPIELDYECRLFQPLAHEEEGDFFSDGKIFKNLRTETRPYVLHGNGRSDMTWLYQNLNK